MLGVVPLCELAVGIEASVWIDFDATWIDPMMSAFSLPLRAEMSCSKFSANQRVGPQFALRTTARGYPVPDRRPARGGNAGLGCRSSKAGTRHGETALDCMESDDDLKDSFYLRIMRSSVGAALREKYALDEPLPDRLAKLLNKLDEPRGVAPIRQYTDNA